jgi:hypothetical protein
MPLAIVDAQLAAPLGSRPMTMARSFDRPSRSI